VDSDRRSPLPPPRLVSSQACVRVCTCVSLRACVSLRGVVVHVIASCACGDGVRGRAASGVFGLEAHDWCESVARRVALLCAEAQHLLRHAEPSRIGRSGHDRRAVG
jgi:hypothetical protein